METKLIFTTEGKNEYNQSMALYSFISQCNYSTHAGIVNLTRSFIATRLINPKRSPRCDVKYVDGGSQKESVIELVSDTSYFTTH